MFKPIDLKKCVEGRKYFVSGEDEDYCENFEKREILFRRRCDCSPDCNLVIGYRILPSGGIESYSSGFLVQEIFEKIVSEIEEEE